MLTLNDGRPELWQWDTGRTLSVDADCSQVHFSNKVFGRSIDVDVVDGVAIIPDILLQTDKDLTAWAFVGTPENGYTKISKVFKVNKRNKPADYVFTPPEQTTLGELIERLDKIEESQDPDAIKNAVDDYIANNPIGIDETDPTVPEWAKHPTKPSYTASEVGALPADTVIPTIPDNVSAFRNDAGYLTEHQDLTGYATEQYVQGYAQPKGDYLTAVPEEYAKTADIPTKPSDIGAQPEGDYALRSEIPSVTVKSVNGKTGVVSLTATDVKARPDSWMPSASDVGALPNTYTPPNQTAEQVGADPKGTATSAVSQHNTADDAHNDIRLELKALADRLTAFFDSDDTTLDELSEIVAYITNNKTLIEFVTTSKVSVADIINNLTTNVSNKPLSAAQGVVLKGLIDGLSAGKLDASKLQEAANDVLAQAKASGEFDGTDGKDGQDGKDGTSATHSWNGTVLTITSASGTSYADLKGEKGDKGDTGEKGETGETGADGTSVTVSSVSESTADGGSNVVTFSDGKTLTVRNGKDGKDAETVPDYVVTEAETVIDRVIAAQGSRTFTFAAISDFHYGSGGNTDGVKHACQAIKLIDERIKLDAVAVLGDYTDLYADVDPSGAYADCRAVNEHLDGLRFVPNLRIKGNHDYSPSAGIMHRYIESYSDDVVWGSVSGGYFYRDFEGYKIRVICVNTNETENDNICCSVEQYNWFIGALDLSNKEDVEQWQIIVLSHHPLDWWTAQGTYFFGNIIKAYESGGSWASGTVSCNFANKNTARLIGNVHGHIHNLLTDNIYVGNVLNSSEKVNAVRMCTPEACLNRPQSYEGWTTETTYTKTAGTAEDTSFCVYCVDLDTYTIKAICYGAGIDREVVYYDNAAPTYTNMIPLSVGTDKKPYNGGQGWKAGTRLNSSGGEASNMDYYVTGFIPVEDWNYVYLKNTNLVIGDISNQPNTRIVTYDSNFTAKRIVLADENLLSSNIFTNILNEDGKTAAVGDAIGRFQIAADDGTAYVRFSTKKIDDTSIVTINEQIVT